MNPFEQQAQIIFDYIYRPQDWRTYGQCPSVEELRQALEAGVVEEQK